MHPLIARRPIPPAHGTIGPSSARARGYVSARAVGTYVPRLTRKAFEKYGFSAATLLTDWAMIVGEELAAFTQPERLKWPRGVATGVDVEAGAEGRPGATLVLRVDPARALDVEYASRQIVERINGYFGYGAIAELRLKQGPVVRRAQSVAAAPAPEPALGPAPELAAIADERLRTALARLKSRLAARASR